MDDETIEAWLNEQMHTPESIASEAYSVARGSHKGGELPKYLRGHWHNIPKHYREFLVGIVRHALDAERAHLKRTIED